MNKLISLLKASMAGGLQLFNYRGKTERSQRIMPIVLGALVWISMLISAGAMATGLQQDGNGVALLSLYTLVTSVIILMEGIYKSSDLLFKPKDNDLLLSMPIPKRHIILARIIKFYIYELLYCLIFLLPAVVAYATTFDINPPLFWLTSITVLLLTPIIPIALSCIIGLISSSISSKFKHKNFFQVIFSFIFLIALAIFIIISNTDSSFEGRAIVAISDKVADYYYPAQTFINLVSDFNIWQYLLFIAVNLIVLVVSTLIVSHFYAKIVSRLGTIKQTVVTSTNYNFKRRSQTAAMIKKEIVKYFNTPVLLMNTAIGLILFIVAVVMLCFKYNDFVISLTSSTENFPLTSEQILSYLPSATVALVAFASLMTFITATIISLEGKTFNLLKTLPISGHKVIMTKVLAAVLLIVPVTALGSIIMAIRFQFGILDTILIFIAVIAAPMLTEMIGVLIDLKYARFNAESDAVVVKQSAGVMVATFLGLGMVLVSISLLFTLVFLAGQTVGLIIFNATLVIVSTFVYFVIAARGAEKYMKLSA